ncbi:hypothetical protein QR680_006205 [Steinernema hermaphroditum]|uniref:WAP domain-containing protein n=1 Tax=Steinernema hermaphroditum TaxID=289476 RepID=A0AA39LX09_9BILA|nr:hypothetical protein QR680_006205 [Steinernema hermaphroditum]
MRLTTVVMLFCLLVCTYAQDLSAEESKTKSSKDFAPYGALGYILTNRADRVCDPPCAPDQKCIKNVECKGGDCDNICFPYTRRNWNH